MSFEIENIMDAEEIQAIGISSLTDEQQQALIRWGFKMFQMGQHIVSEIDEIKYDGRLIILEDGTQWEVDTGDEITADMWTPLDKVLVIDDEMYKLDDLEKVSVQRK